MANSRRTTTELESLLSNPNVRKMLDFIAEAEGVNHSYNTLVGGTRFDSLDKHPNVLVTVNKKGLKSTAAGRYQFLSGTWRELAKKHNLKDFSERSQDIAALALIDENGQLQNVLNGDFRKAVDGLGKTWASMPTSTYGQPTKSWDSVDNFFSTYDKRKQGIVPYRPLEQPPPYLNNNEPSGSKPSILPPQVQDLLNNYKNAATQLRSYMVEPPNNTSDFFGVSHTGGGFNFDLLTQLENSKQHRDLERLIPLFAS